MKKVLIIIASVILVITALITGAVMIGKARQERELESGRQYVASIPEGAYLNTEELKKVISIICTKDKKGW